MGRTLQVTSIGGIISGWQIISISTPNPKPPRVSLPLEEHGNEGLGAAFWPTHL